MGKLFRTPEGFLDLTGQRVGGRYPQEVSDVVAPTLDISAIVGGRLLAVETGASLTSGIGDNIQLTVPDNEVWLLRGVSFEFLRDTNAAYRLEIGVRLTNLGSSSDPANQAYIFAHFFPSGLDVNSNPAEGTTFDRPFALPPGSIIEAVVLDENNTNRSWSLHALIEKLTGN